MNARFALKAVARAARDTDEVTTVLAWANFWAGVEREWVSGPDFEKWVVREWEAFGVPRERFFRAKDAETWLRAIEESPALAALVPHPGRRASVQMAVWALSERLLGAESLSSIER
jgi:hypothetical protein